MVASSKKEYSLVDEEGVAAGLLESDASSLLVLIESDDVIYKDDDDDERVSHDCIVGGVDGNESIELKASVQNEFPE